MFYDNAYTLSDSEQWKINICKRLRSLDFCFIYISLPDIDILVDGKWFDGSISYFEGHRRLQTLAGNAAWVPNFTPRSFTQRGTIHRLLATFHRHNMCCFLTGTFAMFTTGILYSFDSAAVLVVMTDVHAQLLYLIFRRGAAPPKQFLVNGFEFVFEGEEPDLDVYYYTITRGNLVCFFFFRN